jgi:hypothetical protein
MSWLHHSKWLLPSGSGQWILKFWERNQCESSLGYSCEGRMEHGAPKHVTVRRAMGYQVNIILSSSYKAAALVLQLRVKIMRLQLFSSVLTTRSKFWTIVFNACRVPGGCVTPI